MDRLSALASLFSSVEVFLLVLLSFIGTMTPPLHFLSDVKKSLKFYLEALKPLGWREFGAYDSSTGPEGVPDLYGIGDAQYMKNPGSGSSIWLRQRQKGETGLYVGIHADSTKEVEAAYAAALKAEGKDEGAPAERTYFAHGYYAANIADFDGNHVEFVYKDF
jgi:glyoxalase/bleomycin resistance protein/dioxygenase superfamily protein